MKKFGARFLGFIGFLFILLTIALLGIAGYVGYNLYLDNAYEFYGFNGLYVAIAALVAFIIAPFIVPENAVMALRVLCPTIFLSGLLGVFRGYFQAHQTTLYTSISQIVEQILNAIVSIGAAYLFIQPFLETGGSNHKQNQVRS